MEKRIDGGQKNVESLWESFKSQSDVCLFDFKCVESHADAMLLLFSFTLERIYMYI